MSIIIGIDHGYYAIKTAHCSFPAGLTSYGEHEPYTRQGLLEFGGCFFVCGSGRQPIQWDKTVNDNYYLLTLAAIAKEIRQRGLPPECSVRIAAGLPLTSFGRDKPKFKDYLLRSNQPVNYKFEGVEYTEVDLSGMEDMTAGDLCAVAKLANRELGVTPIPEMTLHYAMYMAARASHKPVEFFKGLPPVEAMKLKNLVTGFLYGGDGEE